MHLDADRGQRGCLRDVLREIDRDFATSDAQTAELSEPLKDVCRQLQQYFRQSTALVGTRVLGLLNNAAYRLTGTSEAVRQAIVQLRKTRTNLEASLSEVERECRSLMSKARPAQDQW